MAGITRGKGSDQDNVTTWMRKNVIEGGLRERHFDEDIRDNRVER